MLREYYPALLAAFAAKRGGLLCPEARALLGAAPTPRAAAQLAHADLCELLAQAGRQRGDGEGVDRDAGRVRRRRQHDPGAGEQEAGRENAGDVATGGEQGHGGPPRA